MVGEARTPWRTHLRALAAIARKDLVDALVSLRIAAVIVLPVAISLLYRVILTGDGGLPRPALVVYDPDGSHLTARLGRDLGFRVLTATSLEEVASRTLEEDAMAGLILGPGFDAALERGEQPELRVLINPAQDPNRALVRLLEDQVRRLAGQAPPAQVEVRALHPPPGAGPPGFNLGRYLLLLWLTMSLTMTGIMVPPSLLVEEKERATLKPLLVTPASYGDVIAAKVLVGLIYVLGGTLLILWLNGGLAGNVPLTLLVLLVGGVVTVEVGICLGAFFDDMTALQTWSFVALLPFMLPGIVGPLITAGLFDLEPLTVAVRLVPTYHVITALERTLAGEATLVGLLPELTVLMASAVAGFGLAVRLLRRRE
jgi:ABC-2 type transport system permease protein